MTGSPAGSLKDKTVLVTDIEAARRELTGRGVKASNIRIPPRRLADDGEKAAPGARGHRTHPGGAFPELALTILSGYTVHVRVNGGRLVPEEVAGLVWCVCEHISASAETSRRSAGRVQSAASFGRCLDFPGGCG